MKQGLFGELFDSGLKLVQRVSGYVSSALDYEPLHDPNWLNRTVNNGFVDADTVNGKLPTNEQVLEAARKNAALAREKNEKARVQAERRRAADLARLKKVLVADSTLLIGFVKGPGLIHVSSVSTGKKVYACGSTLPVDRDITIEKCESSKYVPCRKCLETFDKKVPAKVTPANAMKVLTTQVLDALKAAKKPLLRSEIEAATGLTHRQSEIALRHMRRQKLLLSNGKRNQKCRYRRASGV